MDWREEQALTLYVGTYTDQPGPSGERSEGIYRATLLPASGALRIEGSAAAMDNPTFLTPAGGRLYAIGEAGGGGKVAAFAVDPATGELRLINEQPAGGDGTCYVSTDASGRVALVANYVGGSVAALPIGEGGAVGPATVVAQHAMPGEGAGPVADRQDAPHAHCIIPDRNNRFAFAADLGADRIYQYALDPQAGRIGEQPVMVYDVFPGSGPRHLAFHPSGRWLYVTGELSSTLIVYAYEQNDGLLREPKEMSLLPAGWQGENTASEVAVSPDGQFVYAGNRGHDSITVFRVNDDSGTVTLAQHCPTGGSFPRHFAIDPGGDWLVAANQKSGTLTSFRIDKASGVPEWTGQSAEVPAPVCVVFG
jgi:6-phosphogluconolactonase